MADALVNHPAFGSLWLEDARVENGVVIGKVWETLSFDYGVTGGEYLTMNFPLTCVRKWVEREAN